MVRENAPATPRVPLLPVAPAVDSVSITFVSLADFMPADNVMPLAAVTPEPTPTAASLWRSTRFTATAAPIVTLDAFVAEPVLMAFA